ncbi:hypothetical protein ACLOJK_011113 [Asimina triloba]
MAVTGLEKKEGVRETEKYRHPLISHQTLASPPFLKTLSFLYLLPPPSHFFFFPKYPRWKMDSRDPAYFLDELLNFSSDIEDGPTLETPRQQDQQLFQNAPLASTANTQEEDISSLSALQLQQQEDLEWLSNEDVFPKLDYFDIPLLDPKHQSPVSVLESSVGVGGCGPRIPVRPRSKRGRRKWCGISDFLTGWGVGGGVGDVRKGHFGDLKRRCLHCLAEKTPQWRAGPLGPKTLCNACGVRYKAGRLVPEYRPASSPSFSRELHSNSHRKILEMRRKKMKAAENG